MSERKSIPQSIRFAVFKRDKFVCQYCGGKAPDVLLQIDHIKPVAEGGDGNVMNLVTACQACNGGKGARLLDDDSIVERQRRQIEDLEERRQQLEMMLLWRDETQRLSERIHEVIADHLRANTGFGPNANGMVSVKRWAKKFPLEIVLSAVDDCFGKYLRYRDNKPDAESWEEAFRKVESFCRAKVKYGEGPEVDQMVYVQAIVRRRIGDRYYKCMDLLQRARTAGWSMSEATALARRIETEEEFEEEVETIIGVLSTRERSPQ